MSLLSNKSPLYYLNVVSTLSLKASYLFLGVGEWHHQDVARDVCDQLRKQQQQQQQQQHNLMEALCIVYSSASIRK